MPSIYDSKPRFQDLLRPLARIMAQRGITANHVTLAAVILSVVTGALLVLFQQQRAIFFIVPFVLFVRMALNAIDGMLAREWDMKSRLGAVLNELGDVFSDIVLYLPFALVPQMHAALVFGIVLLAVLSEMAGVVAVQIGAPRAYNGPMGKSDRAFMFGVLAVCLGAGLLSEQVCVAVELVMIALLAATIYNRVRSGLKEAA